MQSKDGQQIISIISKIFRKRKMLMILCVIGVVTPVIYYNETATPIYQSSTMLIFDELKDPSSNFGFDASREILMSNRLEEIKSRGFAEDVVYALPEWTLERFGRPEDATDDFDPISHATSVVRWNLDAYPVRASNIISISVQLWDPQLCREVANTAASVLQDRIFSAKQHGVSSVRSFIEQQAERFRQQLSESEERLKEFKQQNRIISIDKDSQGLLRKYTEAEVLYNNARTRRQSTEEKLEAIQRKLAEQKQDLGPSITNIGSSWAQKLQEKLLNLQDQYTNLRVQGYKEDHPKLQAMRQEIDSTKESLKEEALNVVRDDNILNPLTQIENLVTEAYTVQIELEAIKADEAALRRIIKEYDQTMSALPEKEYMLAKLTRDREVNDKIYMNLLERSAEAKISEAEKVANIRIIDPARVPSNPVKPTKRLNLAIGIVLGSLIGFGLSFVLEVANKSLDSSDELEQLTGWAVLTTIPAIDNGVGKGVLNMLQRNGNGKSPNIKRTLIPELDEKSGIGETYRMLRTNLQFLDIGNSVKSIMVTSIGPDEGKSTTLTNLAITLANMEKKVLIIDADLRRPLMHSVFEVDKEPGLADLLVYHNSMKQNLSSVAESQAALGDTFSKERLGHLIDNFSEFVLDSNFGAQMNNLNSVGSINILSSSVNEAVQSTRFENLMVLTSGKQLKNPSETIATVSMKSLLTELKKKFDVILMDTAPLMIVPESMVISSFVDGVLFVVDSKKYNEEMLLKAKGLLDKTKARVLGAVLNNVEMVEQYGGGYYYYGT